MVCNSNLPDHRMSCDGNLTEIRKGVYGEPTVMTGVREHKRVVGESPQLDGAGNHHHGSQTRMGVKMVRLA